MTSPRSNREPANARKRSRKNSKPVQEGSNEEVLVTEVRRLLKTQALNKSASPEKGDSESRPVNASLPDRFTQLEVSISSLSSTGDGLGLSSDSQHVYVVPFTVPGDVVTAKAVTQRPHLNYTLTDLISVNKSSLLRDDTRIQCSYFGRCSGCQFQMLSYPEQLSHKKTVIERAYAEFSNLAAEHIPTIEETVGSPLQYGYRTKLTPHFDAPPGHQGRRRPKGGARPQFTEVPPIGFNVKNMRKVLDVEDCPIGTPAVRQGLKDERKRVVQELNTYRQGATILIRETTTRQSAMAGKPVDANATPNIVDWESEEGPATTGSMQTKSYITDNNGIAVEYVGDYVFHNVAGAFFQNNNSILPLVTQYIRDRIIGSSDLPDANAIPSRPTITNLLDAYCGSGFFTITLSALFKRSIGVDIAEKSVGCAKKNADVNGMNNTRFITATASKIFDDLEVKADETAVIIDPPRKGCDNDFLSQLLCFGPQRIVYVSCNVHTQARDVGILVEGRNAKNGAGCRYKIESICGFDFFPQTSHVEAVVVLDRMEAV